MVHQVYKWYARPLARVVHGLRASWDPIVATVYDEDFSGKVAWSPCDRFIAVAKSRAVEIRDAMTLNLLSTFGFPLDSKTQALSFSPDSCFLTQTDHQTTVTWDLQTGVSVITTFPELVFVGDSGFSHAYSMDGKTLATQCFDRDSLNTLITTRNLSTTHTHVYRVLEGHVVSPLWTHGEFLRFAAVKSGCITIWQAEFTFTHPPEMVESLPTPDEVIEREASATYLFLPTACRLAIALKDTLLVWDARNSKLLLKVSSSLSFMSFSSNGRFFACILRRSGDKGIHIWKESPAGYIPHLQLPFDDPDGCPEPLLSPNGESIILSGNSIIRLLHTEDPFLSSHPSLAMAQHASIMSFSPNDSLAAFVGYLGNVITILDLKPGNPQLKIGTGMKVRWLGVAENTVVAANQEKIVTWKLDTRDARGNIYGGGRITTLDRSPVPSLRRAPPLFMSIFPVLNRIIVLWLDNADKVLTIYDLSTGVCLAGPTSAQGVLKPLSCHIQGY